MTKPTRRYYTQRVTAVCWDCRISRRRPGHPKECPECGEDMVTVGYRVRVPKRRDVKGWERLRASWRPNTNPRIERWKGRQLLRRIIRFKGKPQGEPTP